MSFEPLGLAPALLDALASCGYTAPTPVQSESIPLVLAGHDLMVSAQTGSGKTAAFILPALHRLAEPSPVAGRGPRILVLTPTRELAAQITTAAEKYGSNLPRIRTASILGGMPYPVQNKVLSSRLDILVATPGRLLDHIGRGRVDFSRLEILVIDEADRMLDMGFIGDVEAIGKALPETRQTLLFSATFDGPIADLARELLKDPKRLSIASAQTRHENIEQRLLYADDMGHKNRLLDHLLRDTGVNQALVFTSTKAHADDLADRLSIEGFDAAALHGDMTQRERNRTLLQLRQGRIRVLVATDVAARGIDVQGITHVFNYDLPRMAEDYVHRIGRTGRAGRSGIAISFVNDRDAQQVRRIERYTTQPIPVHTVAGLEPRSGRSQRTQRPQPAHGAGRNAHGPRSASPRGEWKGPQGPRDGWSRQQPPRGPWSAVPAPRDDRSARPPRQEWSQRPPREEWNQRPPRQEWSESRPPRQPWSANPAPQGERTDRPAARRAGPQPAYRPHPRTRSAS